MTKILNWVKGLRTHPRTNPTSPPVDASTTRVIEVLRAYRDLPEGLKPDVFSMLSIIDDPTADSVDKDMATSTIMEALFPVYGKDKQYGIPLEPHRP